MKVLMHTPTHTITQNEIEWIVKVVDHDNICVR